MKIDMPCTLKDLEKIAIEAAIAHTRGNKTRAAKILGISDRTMQRKTRRERLKRVEAVSTPDETPPAAS